jgi:hypothetical protein
VKKKGLLPVTNSNVIARHARNAVGMLADGAIFALGFDKNAAAIVIDEMTERLAEYDGTWICRADALVADMQAMLGDPACPAVIRELLADNGMEP